jgi:hypothetical protein
MAVECFDVLHSAFASSLHKGFGVKWGAFLTNIWRLFFGGVNTTFVRTYACMYVCIYVCVCVCVCVCVLHAFIHASYPENGYTDLHQMQHDFSLRP